jgi:hypothetical protein
MYMICSGAQWVNDRTIKDRQLRCTYQVRQQFSNGPGPLTCLPGLGKRIISSDASTSRHHLQRSLT